MRHGRPLVLFVETGAYESFLMFGAALRRRGARVQRLTSRSVDKRAQLRMALQRLVFDDIDGVLNPRIRGGDIGRLPLPNTIAGARAVEVMEPVGRALLRSGRVLGPRKTAPDVDEALLYDKFAMTCFAREIGIGVPHTWEHQDDLPAGRPVVVKRALGLGGDGVRIVQANESTAAAWSAMAVDDEVVFAQEYVPGPIYSVGGVARRGEIVLATAYESRPAEGNPLGPPARVCVADQPAALESASCLIAALGYTGMFCFDYVGTATAAPLLIDVNPRVFGSWAALQRAGLDLAGAYLYAHDLQPEPPPPAAIAPGWHSTTPFNGLLGKENRRSMSLADAQEIRDFTRVLGWRWLVVRLIEVVATRRSTTAS